VDLSAGVEGPVGNRCAQTLRVATTSLESARLSNSL
jgi:hypothetical protein